MQQIDASTLEKNWKKFEKYCHKLSDNNVNSLLEAIGQRLVMCPASTKKDQYGCYPGGLIEHAIQVTSLMKSLSDVYGIDISMASVIRVGLLHEIGKVGDLDADYFIDQDSEWHREKLGQFYKYNEQIQKMSVSHRTLCLLQHFGVKLTREEWLAIQLSSGSHFEENRFYVGSEPSLALILQQAKQAAIHNHK